MSELHVYQMTGWCECVVAHDPTDAWAVWCENTGEKRADYPDDDFELWPDDRPLTITMIDEPGQPKITKTGAQWAASDGRCHLSIES